MNTKRVIWGPVLSVVFLIFFTYMIAGVEGALSYQECENNAYLGSISDTVENAFLEPAPEPPREPLELNAKSVISVQTDLYSPDKIIFEKDANLQLPIASLTKIMTAAVALDNYKIEFKTLLQIMIVGSNNEAAQAIAEKIENFVSLMNKKAQEIGLKNTFFADASGLSPENVSTATDLIEFTKYIFKNYPEIAQMSQIKEIDIPEFGIIKNTDPLLSQIPNIVFSKTGFTNAARECLLLSVYNAESNSYLINVILGAENRFLEMEKLINWFYK